MGEHTPTPWNFASDQWEIYSEPRYQSVAMLLGNGDCAANAAYIVKAVNSYEPTQDLLTDIWFHFSATDDPTLRKIADRARELIASPATADGVRG